MAITPNPLVPTGAQPVIAALLARMRDDTCVIERQPTTVDAGGAVITGPYTTVATVSCKVRAPGRQPIEEISGGRFGPVIDYEISLPPDTDIRSDDRIVVNGRTMHIVADQDAISHGFELKVLVKATTS